MTVKQLLEITPATQEIWVLNCKGCVFEIDRQEPIAVAAYGDFSIASIEARDTDELEITLKVVPVKEA